MRGYIRLVPRHTTFPTIMRLGMRLGTHMIISRKDIVDMLDMITDERMTEDLKRRGY